MSKFLFLFFFGFTYASEKPIIISLGSNCHIASEFRWNGIRQEAYPFDWNLTPFQTLYRILEEDFALFLEEDLLFLRSDLLGVVNSHYGIQFMHDFPNHNPLVAPNLQIGLLDDYDMSENAICANFLEYLGPIRDKYNRRIQRFRNALSGTEKVIFFRYHDDEFTKDQALSLFSLIAAKYPNLDFTLVACTGSLNPIENWGIPRIKHYYTGMNRELWANVFRACGVLEDL